MSLDEDLLADVVAECQEHLTQMEDLLLVLEQQTEAPDPEVINKIFRSAHSIKGVSGFCGLNNVKELAHNFENVLNAYRQGDMKPTSAAVDVLLKSTDGLKKLLSDALNSESYEIGTYVNELARLMSGEASSPGLDLPARLVSVADPDGRFSLGADEAALRERLARGQNIYLLRLDLVRDAQAKGRTPVELLNSMESYGEIVESSFDPETIALQLEDGQATSIPVGVVFSTLLDHSMAAMALEIPIEDVVPYSPDEQTVPAQTAQAPVMQADPVPVKKPAAKAETAPAPAAAAVKKEAPAAADPAPLSNDEAAALAASSSDMRNGQQTSSLRVNVALLDKLMNLAGELVLSRNQLSQTVSDLGNPDLVPVAQRVDMITSELQAEIMQTRMQPLSQVFGKFPRLVRDVSRALGKKIDLRVEGQEIELDKTILEGLNDPLVHILRNSLDHGVENPAEREAAGKDPVGKVMVRARHEAGQVNIEISDDGGGIDPARLKAKAVKTGRLSQAEAQAMSDQKAMELIFQPGFSTAEVVSEVSGRGVGMDVVRSNLERLGGVLDLQSAVGRGTTVRIKLPLTMAIIPCLIVRLGRERYAVPQINLVELVRVRTAEIKERIERVGGAEILRLRENLLPLLRLGEVLKAEGHYRDPLTNELKRNRRTNLADRRSDETEEEKQEWQNRRAGEDRRQARDALNILILSAGSLEYGLVVDELEDTEEIVVKPLGRHLKEIPAYAGATIMGDGLVAPILDVMGLAEQADLFRKGEEVKQQAEDRRDQENEAGQDMEKMLLFTNGPDEFFAVPIPLVARIERINPASMEHSLGCSSIQYRGQSLRLIMLNSHLPVQPLPPLEKAFVIVFDMRGHEIGLVAGTLVDEKLVRFDLDVHTHQRPGVMGSMIIDGKTVMVVDIFELVDLEDPEWGSRTDRRKRMEKTGTRRILLVEDSEFFRTKVSGYIAQAGFEVLTAENGKQALKVMEKNPVDLVVTDIEMPVMNGYELVQAIRSHPRFSKMNVIALSSLAGDEDIAKGRASGVDRYLIKLDRENLLETITEFATMTVDSE